MCQCCHESGHSINVSAKDDLCDRCIRQGARDTRPIGTPGKKIPTFSSQNRMIPADIPEELKDLSLIEQSAIARISLQMSIHCRKGGKKMVLNFVHGYFD